MSSVRRRPSLLSYFSFSKPPPTATTRYNRSDSVTSNLRDKDIDPYEKPDRHSSSGESSPSSGDMTGGGRSRLFKAVSLVALLILTLWLLVPDGSRKTVEKAIHSECRRSGGGGVKFANGCGQTTRPTVIPMWGGAQTVRPPSTPPQGPPNAQSPLRP